MCLRTSLMGFVPVVVVVLDTAFPGDEGLVSDAATLGYQAGAMSYCSD